MGVSSSLRLLSASHFFQMIWEAFFVGCVCGVVGGGVCVDVEVVVAGGGGEAGDGVSAEVVVVEEVSVVVCVVACSRASLRAAISSVAFCSPSWKRCEAVSKCGNR